MQNWQYIIDEIRDRAHLAQKLADRGSQGWELVQMLEDKGEDRKAHGMDFTYLWTLVFKQPLPEPSPYTDAE